MSKICSFSEESIIYAENTDADGIYILQKGSLSAQIPKMGLVKEKRIRISEGQFFGVKEFFGKIPHEATIRTKIDSVCIKLEFEEFRNLILQKPDVMKSMLRSFANELREIYNIVEKDFSDKVVSEFDRVCEIIKSFYNQKNYVQCFQAASMYEKVFPELKTSENLQKLIQHTKVRGMKETDFNVSAIDEFLSANAVVTDTTEKKLFTDPRFRQLTQIYDNGEIIMLEKQSRDKFYYIESGEAIISKYVAGKNRYMTVARPGEFIGEISAIDGQTSPVTVIAKGMVKLIEFDQQNFESIFMSTPEMFFMIIRQISRTYHRLKYFSYILSLNSVRERISALFRFFADIQTGSKNVNINIAGNRVESCARQIKTTPKEIASWIDASEEEVKDRLKFLDEERIIRLSSDDTIIIYDITKI